MNAKKIIAALIAACLIAGALTAQTAATVQTQQTVTVSGKLELIDGHIGLKSGGTTYYVQGLGRLVGFVKDLQEGSQVKIEGYAQPLGLPSGYAFLIATKLSFGGKDYDLSMNGRGFNRAKSFGPAAGPGTMRNLGPRAGNMGRGYRW